MLSKNLTASTSKDDNVDDEEEAKIAPKSKIQSELKFDIDSDKNNENQEKQDNHDTKQQEISKETSTNDVNNCLKVEKTEKTEANAEDSDSDSDFSHMNFSAIKAAAAEPSRRRRRVHTYGKAKRRAGDDVSAATKAYRAALTTATLKSPLAEGVLVCLQTIVKTHLACCPFYISMSGNAAVFGSEPRQYGRRTGADLWKTALDSPLSVASASPRYSSPVQSSPPVSSSSQQAVAAWRRVFDAPSSKSGGGSDGGARLLEVDDDAFFATLAKRNKAAKKAQAKAAAAQAKASSPARKNAKRKASTRAAVQTHIDAGQRHFDAARCSECGLVYAPGVAVDEAEHTRAHARLRGAARLGRRWATQVKILKNRFLKTIFSHFVFVLTHNYKQSCFNDLIVRKFDNGGGVLCVRGVERTSANNDAPPTLNGPATSVSSPVSPAKPVPAGVRKLLGVRTMIDAQLGFSGGAAAPASKAVRETIYALVDDGGAALAVCIVETISVAYAVVRHDGE